MSLRSTVYWGNDISDDRSVESDEETEVESILGSSNSQSDPMDVDVEEPIGRQSHWQAEERQELGPGRKFLIVDPFRFPLDLSALHHSLPTSQRFTMSTLKLALPGVPPLLTLDKNLWHYGCLA